ncbi:MAG: hypothetical protein ACYTXI_35140 [Nostoc sp.]
MPDLILPCLNTILGKSVLELYGIVNVLNVPLLIATNAKREYQKVKKILFTGRMITHTTIAKIACQNN